MTSSRERTPSAGLSKRLGEIASTRWATGNAVGARSEAWRMNERIAVSRRLRLRGELPRTLSRWSRNASTNGILLTRSVMKIPVAKSTANAHGVISGNAPHQLWPVWNT